MGSFQQGYEQSASRDDRCVFNWSESAGATYQCKKPLKYICAVTACLVEVNNKVQLNFTSSYLCIEL